MTDRNWLSDCEAIRAYLYLGQFEHAHGEPGGGQSVKATYITTRELTHAMLTIRSSVSYAKLGLEVRSRIHVAIEANARRIYAVQVPQWFLE